MSATLKEGFNTFTHKEHKKHSHLKKKIQTTQQQHIHI